jgi:hypothetical protein
MDQLPRRSTLKEKSDADQRVNGVPSTDALLVYWKEYATLVFKKIYSKNIECVES